MSKLQHYIDISLGKDENEDIPPSVSKKQEEILPKKTIIETAERTENVITSQIIQVEAKWNSVQESILTLIDVKELENIAQSFADVEGKIKNILELFGFDFE